jgi:hypothetical protein
LRTSQGYIFFILQHLATKLCGLIHPKTLFLAVVLDFVLLALIKISSIAGITHYGILHDNVIMEENDKTYIIMDFKNISSSHTNFARQEISFSSKATIC